MYNLDFLIQEELEGKKGFLPLQKSPQLTLTVACPVLAPPLATLGVGHRNGGQKAKLG